LAAAAPLLLLLLQISCRSQPLEYKELHPLVQPHCFASTDTTQTAPLLLLPLPLLLLLLLLQISRTPLSRLKYKELHALVQSHGFVHTLRTLEQIQADREVLRRKKAPFMLKPRKPPAAAAAGVLKGVVSGMSVE
jgi:hypothetical protein